MAGRSVDFLSTGSIQLRSLELGKMTTLRRLTFRIPFHQAVEPNVLIGELSTIKSPAFCEFVLEMIMPKHQGIGPLFDHQEHWSKIIEFFQEQFTPRGGFKVTIKTGPGCSCGKATTFSTESQNWDIVLFIMGAVSSMDSCYCVDRKLFVLEFCI